MCSSDLMQHRNDAKQPEAAPQKQDTAKPTYGKEQRKRKAELRTKIKALEEEMEALSFKVIECEEAINSPEITSDHMKLREVCDALDDAKFRQDEAFEEWSALVEEQDAMLEEE